MKRSGNRSALRDFLSNEAAGGILLMLAAVMAMVAANASERSYELYHALLHAPSGPVLTQKLGPMSPHLWINDGLMAVFFLLVGLEIKREFVDGRLSTWERRRLPIIAAAAGMVVPAIIFLFVARGNSTLENGWAIPAATDIAFAMGVLALLGRRAPTSLKLFLTTVAIVDDMGAVAIIAIAYSSGIKTVALLAAMMILGLMYILNKSGVRRLSIYMLCSAALWYAVLLSGVHATIAGVLAAMMIPIHVSPGAPDATDSPLHILEHKIAPWSAYLIVPLFGFANAGLPLLGISMADLLAPLPLGIAAGLFFGKQIGIFGSICLCVKLGLAPKLRGATWPQIYGVSMLCGIGFTMSLFIGALAFPTQPDLVEEAKLGVLLGSGLSALAGFAVLRFVRLHPRHHMLEREERAEAAASPR
ncbi:Na+/H+ antiporter NhaA [Rhizorhapis suberifaciens]|uniref:Na(+)/H(+) antiporter NhaA n=1 Tax=Rhizorhapis suberifaciens TaxID=13656 RepID=A0A840HRM2_9SPHN|nr:Na+/H+ antiporter NhaA [Rhizorhapis suberifaciens]MBB4640238.1 NhaA family Na+:H+ antiporter [Rhizorhapis suberifaciens]